MSLIAGEIVLIHVHEGTLISAWSFTTTEAKEAFEANHRTFDVSWGAPMDEDDGTRHLPDGTFDDPQSDTWIEVEAAMVMYVDGGKPDIHVCSAECG